jgi:UDP-N-acetylmuramate--alanine ligase
MEPKGEAAGVRVYDSYAHHPTEIAGDLQSARALAGEGRVVVAFQPHLVSRTRIFGTRMGVELGAADEVVVLDVYLAREEPDPEVTGALVAGAVPLPAERVAFVPGIAEAADELVARARPGDLVLTLGAGTVTQVGPRVLELLRSGARRGA